MAAIPLHPKTKRTPAPLAQLTRAALSDGCNVYSVLLTQDAEPVLEIACENFSSATDILHAINAGASWFSLR